MDFLDRQVSVTKPIQILSSISMTKNSAIELASLVEMRGMSVCTLSRLFY